MLWEKRSWSSQATCYDMKRWCKRQDDGEHDGDTLSTFLLKSHTTNHDMTAVWKVKKAFDLANENVNRNGCRTWELIHKYEYVYTSKVFMYCTRAHGSKVLHYFVIDYTKLVPVLMKRDSRIGIYEYHSYRPRYYLFWEWLIQVSQ